MLYQKSNLVKDKIMIRNAKGKQVRVIVFDASCTCWYKTGIMPPCQIGYSLQQERGKVSIVKDNDGELICVTHWNCQ